MKRRAAPDPRRAKLHFNYTVAEAAKLFGVHRNTVRAWTKAGLETVKSGHMILILGDALRAFLEKRRQGRRSKTPPGWLYCFRCRAPRPPGLGMVELIQTRAGTGNVRAVCGECDALMHRRVSLARLEQSGFPDLAPRGAGCT
jgi:excisionase family DNA binding protein